MLQPLIGGPTNWKGTSGFAQASQLIDLGIMLKWRDMRTLRRVMSPDDEEKSIRHFARRLVERAGVRLQAEILVESVLIWLANAASEKLMNAFLEELFAQPRCDEACWALVEISLTSEVTDNAHDLDIFEMAVALICELGLSVMEYERTYPGEFPRAQALLDHVATYLLSVSNQNSTCIRLSLLHYFGIAEYAQSNKLSFNRIMGRFGHTVLDHLFSLLFRKRSEAVALQYLLENLPFVLAADSHSQKIVHETFKFYMLKQPERFSLFIQAFTDDMLAKSLDDPRWEDACRTYVQHLGAMLKISSDVNHRQLGREFLTAVLKFRSRGYCDALLDQFQQDPEMRRPFRELLEQLRTGDNPEEVIDAVSQFRNSKRGRKPSFARVSGYGTMHQVAYLGSVEASKAS